MKIWAIAAIVLLIGMETFTPAAHAEPRVQSNNPKRVPFQDNSGPDISENAWQNWQAPVATVDPDRLISDNSTNLNNATASAELKSGAFQVAEGKPIQVEATKPIEKIESASTENPDKPAPMLATVAPKPKSDSKRIIVIAVISVAVLGYRKFRRASANPYPPKPNFL